MGLTGPHRAVPMDFDLTRSGDASARAMIMNTIRLEMEPAGMTVINIYPGTTRTAFEVNAPRERGLDGAVCWVTCVEREGKSRVGLIEIWVRFPKAVILILVSWVLISVSPPWCHHQPSSIRQAACSPLSLKPSRLSDTASGLSGPGAVLYFLGD